MTEEYSVTIRWEEPKPKAVAFRLDEVERNAMWRPKMKYKSLPGEHTLSIKQVVLGPEAKEGDVNVVRVMAMGYSEEVVVPIAVMKGGTDSQFALNISFPHPSVFFHLVQGSGPVHLLGQHIELDEAQLLIKMKEIWKVKKRTKKKQREGTV